MLGAEIAPDAADGDDRLRRLAVRRPLRARAHAAGLTRDAGFPDDDLDPARCHGDVLLQICAGHRDTVVHALRELLRPVRGAFALRWTVDGFQSAARGGGAPRNLFGFRDGTSNPDVRRRRADAPARCWTPDGGPTRSSA